MPREKQSSVELETQHAKSNMHIPFYPILAKTYSYKSTGYSSAYLASGLSSIRIISTPSYTALAVP